MPEETGEINTEEEPLETGLSLNTIIIACIILIVLIILWAIFTGRLSSFLR